VRRCAPLHRLLVIYVAWQAGSMKTWTPELLEAAIQAANSGQSASQIAALVSEAAGRSISRNAVIGVLYRKKVRLRGSSRPPRSKRNEKRAKARTSRRAVIPHKPKDNTPLPPDFTFEKPTQHPNPSVIGGLPLLATNDNHCRYFISDFHVCANPVVNRSFCAFHYAKCYKLANDN